MLHLKTKFVIVCFEKKIKFRFLSVFVSPVLLMGLFSTLKPALFDFNIIFYMMEQKLCFQNGLEDNVKLMSVVKNVFLYCTVTKPFASKFVSRLKYVCTCVIGVRKTTNCGKIQNKFQTCFI